MKVVYGRCVCVCVGGGGVEQAVRHCNSCNQLQPVIFKSDLYVLPSHIFISFICYHSDFKFFGGNEVNLMNTCDVFHNTL